MKFNWNNWNIGGKIIFIAACVASVSMLMNWVDIGFRAESGLSQGTFLFLGLWVYLALILLTNKAMDRGLGLVCSIASVGCTVWYISSKSVEFMGSTMNLAGDGAALFLLASVVLIVGIVKYKPVISDKQDAEQGIGTHVSSSTYTGETNSEGKPDGRATMADADRKTFTGETNIIDEPHGQGTATYADASTYTGEWRDGERNGHGTETYADGSTYTGEWKNDERNGQGSATYADGSTYSGEWKDGLPSGEPTPLWFRLWRAITGVRF